MVIAIFSLKSKEKRSQFIEITFLLADINIDIFLEIHFFPVSNIEIDFIGCYIY